MVRGNTTSHAAKYVSIKLFLHDTALESCSERVCFVHLAEAFLIKSMRGVMGDDGFESHTAGAVLGM